MSLKDKVVLITGGGTRNRRRRRAGVRGGGQPGRAERPPRGRLRRTAEAIDPGGRGERVAVVAGDIADPQTSRRMVETAVRKFGGVDVLFNNAGIFRPKPFLQVTPAELNEYLRLVGGYYFAAQAAIAEMRNRGAGGRGEHRLHVGPPRDRRHAMQRVLHRQGRRARADDQPGHRVRPRPHPRQRHRPRRRRNPAVR